MNNPRPITRSRPRRKPAEAEVKETPAPALYFIVWREGRLTMNTVGYLIEETETTYSTVADIWPVSLDTEGTPSRKWTWLLKNVLVIPKADVLSKRPLGLIPEAEALVAGTPASRRGVREAPGQGFLLNEGS